MQEGVDSGRSSRSSVGVFRLNATCNSSGAAST